ncbi:hypothetical protein AAMO2058_001737800, partial [Amorphochlora amoebiformis]
MVAAVGGRSPPLIPPLAAFAFFWSHVALFHTLPPLLRSGWRSNLYAIPLTVLSLSCLAFPSLFRGTLLLFWVVVNLSFLLARGSVSNHILMELCMCAAVITSIVASAIGTAREGQEAKTQYYLGRCLRKQLGALYIISAIHKMNTGFFDPQKSCSSQIIAITTIQLLPKSLVKFAIPGQLTYTAPLMGLLIEIVMGLG